MQKEARRSFTPNECRMESHNQEQANIKQVSGRDSYDRLTETLRMASNPLSRSLVQNGGRQSYVANGVTRAR